MGAFIIPPSDSTRLTVFFYLAQQFSLQFRSSPDPLKYKMIIPRRSMRILNANCEVLICVPSLCTAKGFISLSIHFPCYGWILHFLSFTTPSPNLFPPPICSLSLLRPCISSQLPLFLCLSHPALPFSSSSPLLPPRSSRRHCCPFRIRSRWGGFAGLPRWSFLGSHTYWSCWRLTDWTCEEKITLTFVIHFPNTINPHYANAVAKHSTHMPASSSSCITQYRMVVQVSWW